MSMMMACATTTCTTQESVQVPYMPTKRWIHYALTVDFNAKSMSIYVDGEIVTQGAVTNASAFPTGTSLIIGGTQGLQMLVCSQSHNWTCINARGTTTPMRVSSATEMVECAATNGGCMQLSSDQCNAWTSTNMLTLLVTAASVNM
jgi:hypothetical protein